MKANTLRQIKTLRDAIAENKRHTTELLKVFSLGKESDEEILFHSNEAFLNAVSWVLVSFEPHIGKGITMLEHLSGLMAQIDPNGATSPGVQPGVERSSRNGLVSPST